MSEREEASGGGRAPLAREAVSAVLLCGGRSSRMGADKAQLVWEGRTLLERIAAGLKPQVSAVYLGTGAQPKYEELGLPCLLDRGPDLGPLAGLEAALVGSATPWVLLVACDLPGLSPEVTARLFAAPQPGDQVVQFGSLEAPEPLCALYHRSVLGAVRGALQAGRRRMTSFLNQDACDPIQVRWVPLPDSLRSDLRNVNAPEEWSRWQAEQSQGCEPGSEGASA